jgi:hypothetical protein
MQQLGHRPACGKTSTMLGEDLDSGRVGGVDLDDVCVGGVDLDGGGGTRGGGAVYEALVWRRSAWRRDGRTGGVGAGRCVAGK